MCMRLLSAGPCCARQALLIAGATHAAQTLSSLHLPTEARSALGLRLCRTCGLKTSMGSERTVVHLLQDDIRRHTTPSHRAPEMYDLYSRVPIDHRVDLWVSRSC